MLVFANKTDINRCMDENEIQVVCLANATNRRVLTKYPSQGLKLDEIRTHKWHVIRCSAITGINLKEGLAWVVEDAKTRLFLF